MSKKFSRNFVVSKKFSRNFPVMTILVLSKKVNNWQQTSVEKIQSKFFLANNSSFVKKVNHWDETMSKKFSRNFSCQNHSSFVEKSEPLTRNLVEKIQSKFCLSKQFSYICQNTCRKYSGPHLMFENFMSKFFSKKTEKCGIFYNVEIIPGLRTRLLNIFECRKNSVFSIW